MTEMSTSVPTICAKILPLPRRRSYLDACRELGVFQEREELVDEHRRLKADADLRNARDGGLVTHCAEVADMCQGAGVSRQALETALAHQRAQIEGRVAAVCDAIKTWPLAGPWFPLLAHLITTEKMRPDQIGPLLLAAAEDEAATREAAAVHGRQSIDQFKGEMLRQAAANDSKAERTFQ